MSGLALGSAGVYSPEHGQVLDGNAMRFAQILAVGEKRIHIGRKMAIDPAEGFSVACPSRENILQCEAVITQALGAVAPRSDIFIPCTATDRKRVAAEHRTHPVMKRAKPHVAGQRG